MILWTLYRYNVSKETIAILGFHFGFRQIPVVLFDKKFEFSCNEPLRGSLT